MNLEKLIKQLNKLEKTNVKVKKKIIKKLKGIVSTSGRFLLDNNVYELFGLCKTGNIAGQDTRFDVTPNQMIEALDDKILQVSNDEDGAADFSSTILLEAKKSFIMGSPHDGIQVSDANANVITTLVDLESIIVDPEGNTVQVELFIAECV